MRKTEDLKGWHDFEQRLHELYDEHRSRKADPEAGHVSDLLFRGQSNADWTLAATLERYAVVKPELLRANEYYHRIFRAKPQIETYTGTRWEIDTPPQYDERLKNSHFPHEWFAGQIYEYMIYLRHHGFPSPFLDWSRSPYVAAFFALRDTPEDAQRVAVYAFLENAGRGKFSVGGRPRILGLGPYVAGHKRHFLQQSQYTVCPVDKRDPKTQVCLYGSHQTALEAADVDQDILWKLTLPAADRAEILEVLELHNINAFSLFGSDESLMETLALRELMRD